MHINLHLLRLFFTVANAGSFSEAAKHLFISQPAVSKAVRELEHQLEIPLIERGNRGRRLQLTDNGHALYEHARGIFALEKAALDDLHARTGLKRGTLVIGTSTTIAAYWLAPYLADFARDFPDIALEVRVANTRVICEALVDCTIDVALVEGSAGDSRIKVLHWQEDPLTIVVAAHSPLATQRALSAANLNGQTWLMREPGSGTREITEQLFEQYKLVPTKTFELGSNEAIARAVAAGLGMAMLPSVVVEDLVALKRISTLSLKGVNELSRPLSCLQYRSRALPPAAKIFIKRLYATDVQVSTASLRARK